MPARIDELARSLIEEHGIRAVGVAVERLNQSIESAVKNRHAVEPGGGAAGLK